MKRLPLRHPDNLTVVTIFPSVVPAMRLVRNTERAVADGYRNDEKDSPIVRYESNDRIPTKNDQRVDERCREERKRECRCESDRRCEE